MECRHRKYDNKSYLVTGWQHMHTCLLLQIAVATRLMRVQRIYAHAVTILLLLALFPTGEAFIACTPQPSPLFTLESTPTMTTLYYSIASPSPKPTWRHSMQMSPLLRHAATLCCSSPGICLAFSLRCPIMVCE